MINLRRAALSAVGLVAGALLTGGVTTASALPTAPFNDVYVLAHQDDDLIFANPDIAESIAAGNTVSIIYTTSGLDTATDSTAYWLARLNGERAAYAQMAGVANTWTTTPCSATQIYARLDTDPVRESVARATSAMLAAGRGKPADVADLKGRKRAAA